MWTGRDITQILKRTVALTIKGVVLFVPVGILRQWWAQPHWAITIHELDTIHCVLFLALVIFTKFFVRL